MFPDVDVQVHQEASLWFGIVDVNGNLNPIGCLRCGDK